MPHAATLLALGVREADAADIVATLPRRSRRLDAARRLLTAGLDGGWAPPALVYRGWPAWPPPPWTWFYAQLFLLATPSIRHWHARHGIDDEVSWATLADVGRRIGLYRLAHPDQPRGLDDPRWLVHHYRGQLLQLGRLQYLQRGRDLEIHIPTGGPLAPDAVNASLTRAGRYYRRTSAVCRSWLLDPQLAEHLPPASNIVRFQRRFRLDDSWRHDGDRTIVADVFHQPNVQLAALPQDTTLERAVVAHLSAGRHWHVRRGWCDLAPDAARVAPSG